MLVSIEECKEISVGAYASATEHGSRSMKKGLCEGEFSIIARVGRVVEDAFS